MLPRLPSELIQLILERLAPIDILKLGLTCRRLYRETNDLVLWRPYLMPERQIPIAHPKATFFENIENCPVPFWHLHPKGIKPYNELKAIANDHHMSNMEKAWWISGTATSENYIKIIMALIHPDYRAIYALDDSPYAGILIFINILLKKHEKVLLFFLKDPYYKEICLTLQTYGPRLLARFVLLAIDHNISLLNNPSTETLLDHIVNTLEQRQAGQSSSP